MAKQIFLKVYIPEGQRHAVIDPVTLRKQRPGYLLFADKCLTPIDDKNADMLLNQNPHILSEQPMTKKDINVTIKSGYVNPDQSPDHQSRKTAAFDLNLDEPTARELETEKQVKDAKAQVKKKVNKLAEITTVKDVAITEAVRQRLEEVAKMSDNEFNGLKMAELTEIGASIGVIIPAVGVKKVDALASVNKQAAYLQNQVASTPEQDFGEDVNK